MTNKEKVAQAIEKEYGSDYTIGCFDDGIEQLTNTQLKKVIEELTYSTTTDVDVTLKKKPYIVEVEEVSQEIDFYLISKATHHDRYCA